MIKTALFSFVALNLAFSSIPDVAMAETNFHVSEQLLAQSPEEPLSPEVLIDDLDLSEEQREQIREILDEYQPEVSSTYQELLPSLQNLIDTTVPTASPDKIRIARQDVIYLKQKLSNLLFERLMAIRSKLTVEQREKINQRLREIYGQ